jgi:hypothetical protein
MMGLIAAEHNMLSLSIMIQPERKSWTPASRMQRQHQKSVTLTQRSEDQPDFKVTTVAISLQTQPKELDRYKNHPLVAPKSSLS